jgi:hypothetical protein
MPTPQLLVILGSIAAVLLILGLTVVPIFKRALVEEGVRVEGTDATATIRALEDTGTRVNESPEIAFVLWVEPAQLPAYEAELTTTVSIVDLVHYRVGARVHVRYDPQQPSRIALIGPAPADAPAPTP